MDFAAFALGLAFVLGTDFSALTCFIGAPQQITSQSSHPQTSSTKTTSPHSSHLYLSPFFFTKNHLPKRCLIFKLFFRNIRISQKSANNHFGCFGDSLGFVKTRSPQPADISWNKEMGQRTCVLGFSLTPTFPVISCEFVYRVCAV